MKNRSAAGKKQFKTVYSNKNGIYVNGKWAKCHTVSIILIINRISVTEDLQLLQTGVEQIQEGIHTASGLLDRISQIHSQMRLKRSHENKMMLQSFKNLVLQISKDSGKQIELNVKKFSLNDIPYKKQFRVKDIMIQLLRNAVAHGIESPEERKALGKKASGLIEISSFKAKNKFGFAVRDDGRGLQIEKIRERAIQIGQ
jgi:chemotaxis protein histidine kinase CheA